MSKTTALTAILSLLLFGCTSVLSNQVIREADDKVSFQDLQKQPQRYRGAVVILGGQIIETLVKESETRVQVLQLPLGSGQRPDVTAPSQGRFIVIYKRFVDPLIYEKGRKITVAGAVEGSQPVMLNDGPRNVPVLIERESYLWKTEDVYPAYAPGPAVQFGIGIGVGR
ncbi:MAG TPA: Slp family lipoprotein [Syntrophales bacterium]|nr:Slp family lipoprotein [Syntrophales bacterium]